MIENEVMAMRNKGAGINKIASELGITRTTVRKIIESKQKTIPYVVPDYALERTTPQAQADARDADGEAFRTAARLGLTLRFYGNCAQSGAPGTPSVYEVTTGPDSAEAMRASIDRAAIAAAKGE